MERRNLGDGVYSKGGRALYVRVSVPRSVWPVVGRRELVRSACTPEYGLAVQRRDALRELLREEIEALGQGPDRAAVEAAIERASALFDATVAVRARAQRAPTPLEARVRELEALVARLTGEQGAVPAAPARHPVLARGDVLLRELTEKYIADKRQHSAVGGLHVYSVAVEDLLRQLPDADATVGDVEFNMLQAWADRWQEDGRTLESFWHQRGRVIRHMVATFASVHGLADSFTVGEVERFAKAVSLRLNGRRMSVRERGSPAFTVDELRMIFAPDFAETHSHDRGHAGSKLARVVGPLLALLAGLRREETAWLRCGAALRPVQGVPCIAVEAFETKAHPTGRWAPKTSASSTRVIPVHRALLPLLERMVLGRKPEELLLEGLTVDGRGQRGGAMARSFGERVRTVLPGHEGSLHGLRKTFATLLFEAGVDGDVRDDLVGHGGGIRRVYAAPAHVGRLEEAVNRIDAPMRALIDILVKKLTVYKKETRP